MERNIHAPYSMFSYRSWSNVTRKLEGRVQEKRDTPLQVALFINYSSTKKTLNSFKYSPLLICSFSTVSDLEQNQNQKPKTKNKNVN